MEQQQQFDQSRPTLAPNHFDMVLRGVQKRNNYLDLGMETGQNFFQLYHKFQGDVVGFDKNSQHVEFVKQKAEKLLPSQAITRAHLVDGDIFKMADNMNKKFDLVTVGSQIDSFGNPDKFYEFAKQKLLSANGTLALTSLTPIDVQFQTSYDDKENEGLRNDFNELQEVLREYQILPSNPVYNQGVMMRHFKNIQKFEENVENVIEADQVFQYFQTMPSYIKYIKDDTQVNKSALQNFENKVRQRIQNRSLQMSRQQSLLRVSHKIMTFLLRK